MSTEMRWLLNFKIELITSTFLLTESAKSKLAPKTVTMRTLVQMKTSKPSLTKITKSLGSSKRSNNSKRKPITFLFR